MVEALRTLCEGPETPTQTQWKSESVTDGLTNQPTNIFTGSVRDAYTSKKLKKFRRHASLVHFAKTLFGTSKPTNGRTNQPTNELTWVGAIDTCVSKDIRKKFSI